MSEVLVNGKPISSLRVIDLKEELEKRGLSKNGRKDELAQRLQSFLEVNPEIKEDLNEDDTIDVIEASRLEAQKQREDEEQREAKRRQEECLRRERELQELRELVGVSPTREEQQNLEEQKHAEEQKKAEEERVEQLRREEEEQERKRKEQERKRKEDEERKAKEKLRVEEERMEKKRLQKEEEKRQEMLHLEAMKKKEEDKRRKAEEEERLKQEEEKRRKEVQRKLEEEQKKIQEEKLELAAVQKEEDRKRKEEDGERKQKEEQKWLEEERRKEEAENKLKEEAEQVKKKEAEAESASIREENRLKEKLLQRLREDKAKKTEDSKISEDSINKERAKEEKENVSNKEEVFGEEKKEVGKEGGGEEGGGDDTLVMEIDQSDLVAVEQPEDKQVAEKPLPIAKPGEVKPLRRLGSNKSEQGDGGTPDKRKRGWGASRTSRQDSTENIDVSSNSLKDIVPDPSNLLTKLIPGAELDEVEEEEDEMQNGHNTNKNGDHESDEEIGPSLPKVKKVVEKPVRKQIVLDEASGEEESDTILILNLVRPFTPHQLKEMLKRTGTILDFWLNRIKSKCCVQFSSQEEASETRMALNGVTWPIDNKNPLRVAFTTTENMEQLKTSADEAAERLVVSNGARSGIISVRDWDKDRLPVSQRKRSSSPSRGDRRSRHDTPPPPVQTKSLEELFKKTKATPALYWKPLSSEVIAKKEEARNRRVLEATTGTKSAGSKSRRSRS